MWYRVTVSSGHYLWGNSASGVGFYIYDNYGKDVDTIIVDTSGEYLFPSSGTYYIRVIPKDGNTSNYGTYTIGTSSYYY
jgi:hypothetical protein